MTEPFLVARNIAKRFGALTALADVDLEIRAGEVLALLGDNGAGKSTFIKILAGAHAPSDGELVIEGKPVAFSSPKDAAAAGIATIFQELALSENLSIAENVFLGRELKRSRARRSVSEAAQEMRQRVDGLLQDSMRISPIRKRRSAACRAVSARPSPSAGHST